MNRANVRHRGHDETVEAASLNANVTPHGLRHTAAMLWINARR